MYPSNTNSITGIVLTSRVTFGHAKNGGVRNFPLLAEKDLDNFAVLKPILFRTLTKKKRVERKWKWKLIFFLSFFLSGTSLFPDFFPLVRPLHTYFYNLGFYPISFLRDNYARMEFNQPFFQSKIKHKIVLRRPGGRNTYVKFST